MQKKNVEKSNRRNVSLQLNAPKRNMNTYTYLCMGAYEQELSNVYVYVYVIYLVSICVYPIVNMPQLSAFHLTSAHKSICDIVFFAICFCYFSRIALTNEMQ